MAGLVVLKKKYLEKVSKKKLKQKT